MSENTFVRDELARERTKLSNERTLLAYGRTVLGLIGLAILIFKFAASTSGIIAGLFMLTAAVCVSLFGVRSYRMASARIADHSTREVELAVLLEEN
jgi:uncharacterized membrane protein YidH (DUF202 family)